MHRRPFWVLLTAAVAGVAAALPQKPAPPKAAAPVAFNRDIRPILSENCFLCHGPDRNTRQAGLRLDIREDALRAGAFVPGKPERSPLVARVFAKDDALRMPPSGAHRTLTAAQKDLLRRWVAQGAPYERHWAFTPPAPGARGDIDRLVRARLKAAGLKPSPPADRPTLIRRVTLDLTGLPPTPAEVDAFLADKKPGAYERVVDRLLASPAYGERMATPWLDVARYADSYGYQSDQLSPTWPFRDWVVRAFNRNLPYDRFLTEQLAGDLLPGATREQRLATSFNRLHRMTNEGGSVAEEWRLEYVADRVRTLGTAFLGLTLECARCHDHKFDPVSQRDFYAFTAFFNSIDEYGLYNQSDIVPTPSLLLPTSDQEKAMADAADQARQAQARSAEVRASREAAFQAWKNDSNRPKTAEIPDLVGRFDFEAFDGAALKNLAPGATQNGARSDEVPLVPGRVGKAALLDGENNVNFPKIGSFTRHTPFTIAFWMKDARPLSVPLVVFHASSGTDVGFHGYDLLVENGVLTARLFRHWPGNAIGVRTVRPVPKDVWTHVAVVYDGSSRASGLKLFVNGRPAALETVRDHLWKGTGQHTLTFGQRFRDRGFQGGAIDELSVFARNLTPLEIAQLIDGASLSSALAHPERSEADLRAYYLSAVDPQARADAAAVAAARQRVWATEDAAYEVPVMEELPKPRPTFVLARGRYDAPRTDANRVGRSVPAALAAGGKPPAVPDRLALARWLTRPDHPLTARVAVNRFWALLFGQGLVETLEDFGIQGRPPTHPELLDGLARDFVNSGWDVKALLRKIVLSATYRQASALRSDLRARDPQNLLLARGPSHRLGAETIRDLALAASGLLDARRGGPPVSPYQPGDLWRETNTMSPGYRQSVGGDLYRRSLYTVWKRTAPMPNMLAFDATSREVCVARRSSTNTPLQAFVLLNDPQFVEAARVLAEGTLKRKERVADAFHRLTSRAPTAEEARLLDGLYASQRAAFAADPAAARALLAVGERKTDPDLPPADAAAMTVVCQAILNLDATLWKR